MGAFAARSHRDNKYASNKRPIRRGLQEGPPRNLCAVAETQSHTARFHFCLSSLTSLCSRHARVSRLTPVHTQVRKASDDGGGGTQSLFSPSLAHTYKLQSNRNEVVNSGVECSEAASSGKKTYCSCIIVTNPNTVSVSFQPLVSPAF